MAAMNKLIEIGLIAGSLAIGFLAFYLLSDRPKQIKKKLMDELFSQLINLVILIWVGKIVLNISIFLTDPISVLAYPSDSKAFYFAMAGMAIILFYKVKWKNFDIITFIHSFVYIFLFGAFVYEFIEVVFRDHPFAIGQLVLLSVLIGLFIFLKMRLTLVDQLMILLTAFMIGMFILLNIQPYVTVFNYMMTEWFVGLFYLVSLIGLIICRRKRDT